MKKYFLLFGLTLALGLFLSNTSNAQFSAWGDNPTYLNYNLGLGTSTPAGKLHVHMTATGVSQLQRMVRTGAPAAGITFDKANNGETAAGGADFMGSFVGRLHDGSGYVPRAGIRFAADGTNTTGQIVFQTHDGSGSALTALTRMVINKDGKVGIGVPDMTKLGTALLGVNGKILATEVEVKLYGSWPDFVFKKDYQLMPLCEVENFINENGHLPNVPNEAQVKENGINLGQMDGILLQKIEELTLHIIQLNKRIAELEK